MFVIPKKISLRRGFNRCTGEVIMVRVLPADTLGTYTFCQLHGIDFVKGADLCIPFHGRIYHSEAWCDTQRSALDCMFNPDFPGCPRFCYSEW